MIRQAENFVKRPYCLKINLAEKGSVPQNENPAEIRPRRPDRPPTRRTVSLYPFSHFILFLKEPFDRPVQPGVQYRRISGIFPPRQFRLAFPGHIRRLNQPLVRCLRALFIDFLVTPVLPLYASPYKRAIDMKAGGGVSRAPGHP